MLNYELMVLLWVLTPEAKRKTGQDVPLKLLTNDIGMNTLGAAQLPKFASPVDCFIDFFTHCMACGATDPGKSYAGQFWEVFFQFFGDECGCEGKFALVALENDIRFENDTWFNRVVHQNSTTWWGRLACKLPFYRTPKITISAFHSVVHQYKYIPEMCSVGFYHMRLDGRIVDMNNGSNLRSVEGIPQAMQDHLQALRNVFHEATVAHGDWISPEYFQAIARQLYLVYTGNYLLCDFTWNSRKSKYEITGKLALYEFDTN